jgi:hypothetical protein
VGRRRTAAPVIICGRDLSAELLQRLRLQAVGLSLRNLGRWLCETMGWVGPSRRPQLSVAVELLRTLVKQGILGRVGWVATLLCSERRAGAAQGTSDPRPWSLTRSLPPPSHARRRAPSHRRTVAPPHGGLRWPPVPRKVWVVSEIIFEVHADESDGGYVATALGHAIATQGENLDELRDMVREAVQCHFGDGRAGEMPRIIRLHFVHDEVLSL